MSWHKGTRKMICRTRMSALPHTFGPIKLLAYLVEALWFPGQTFSNGQFSCRVAPLCLLGLEVRTGRWSAVWAWIVVATLFQTCFRPAKINAWCWCIRVCSWVLPSEASQRAWRCRRHGGGMMCIYTYQSVSTYLSMYLSIYLSVSINIIFHFTYLFKDTYIKLFFNMFFSLNIFGHPLPCNQSTRSAFRIQCLLGSNSERWNAAAMAPNYTSFYKLSTFYVMVVLERSRKMLWWKPWFPGHSGALLSNIQVYVIFSMFTRDPWPLHALRHS